MVLTHKPMFALARLMMGLIRSRIERASIRNETIAGAGGGGRQACYRSGVRIAVWPDTIAPDL
jgi:hypothetical protein